MEPITRTIPATIREDVLGVPCVIRCHLTQTVDLLKGDQLDQLTVDEIITTETGQMVFTKELSVDQFKGLIYKCLAKIRDL